MVSFRKCRKCSGAWEYLVVKIKKRSEEDFEKVILSSFLGAQFPRVAENLLLTTHAHFTSDGLDNPRAFSWRA